MERFAYHSLPMKNSIFVLILLLMSGHFAAAGTNPSAEQALTTAEKQANLFSADAGPFRLEIDFVAQNVVPMKGHLTLKWAAENRWWRSVTLGDFHEIDVRNGEYLYISRNLGYTPIRIKELESLMQLFKDGQQAQITKVKQRTEHGASLMCLQLQRKGWKEKNEFCIDPNSHDLFSDLNESSEDTIKKEYADYHEFRGHRYPATLTFLNNGSKAVNATVTDLETSAFNEALLMAPAGSIKRRRCRDMQNAIAISTPEPLLPPSIHGYDLNGEAKVALTVLTDGSVDNIQLIESGGGQIDETTLNSLKRWKFKPAMCGMEPVVSDIEVGMNFQTVH